MPPAPTIVPGRFADQIAFITGGASGIGKAIAHRLGRENACVVLFDINQTGLQTAVADFKSENCRAFAIAGDASDESAVKSAVAKTVADHGRLDVLVHCAGITGPTGKNITEVSVDDYDHVYRVNQRSSFLLAKHALAPMIKANYGRILMFASIAGKEGNPGMSAYSSTKAAVIGLVKGLGKEFATTGITVNAMAPAVISTPLNVNTHPDQLKYMIDKIPMKRLGTVEEVAALAAWICSREASFTTGFTFDLSGGRATY